ncbi:MAG: hypothetical protein EOP48_14515 [Sphingobacteriales bacterium]|nr:MAG: hypothetical protein EOP48_14515 [Sphingobacteriales bacterium]
MTAKKRKRLLLVFAVVIVIFLIPHIASYVISRTYSPCTDWKGMYDQQTRYHWLFDGDKASLLDCKYPTGNLTQGNYRFLYTYNNRHRYFIIEEAKLNNVPLSKVKDTISDLTSDVEDYINPSAGGDMGWGGHITFTSKVCVDSSNTLKLIFAKDSKVLRTDSSNRIVFSGLMQSVLIQNEHNENQHLLQYDNLTPTAIILYKPEDILYLIVVNAFEGQGDVNIAIKGLNLK